MGCPLDLDELDGPTFFRLATRTPAYSGVMAARLAAESQAGGSPAPAKATSQERELPSTRGVLLTEFDDLVDHVEV